MTWSKTPIEYMTRSKTPIEYDLVKTPEQLFPRDEAQFVYHSLNGSFVLFCFIVFALVKTLSVISGRAFLGTKQRIKCLVKGHNTLTLPAVRLGPVTFRSPV